MPEEEVVVSVEDEEETIKTVAFFVDYNTEDGSIELSTEQYYCGQASDKTDPEPILEYIQMEGLRLIEGFISSLVGQEPDVENYETNNETYH